MFDVEKEVPSLELCKRLKELGFPQDDGGGWYWVEPIKYFYNKRIVFWNEKFERYYKENKDYIIRIKAPTCRELGEWLPTANEKQCFYTYKNSDGWTIWEDENGLYDKEGNYITADTEPNARAKMLIWLRENGYVKFEKEE